MGQAGRRDGGGQRAAALGRALLRRQRDASTASTPTCRSCATPTATRTSRRRSAASSSAASSREAKPWVAPDQIPYPFEFQLLEEDWDHFADPDGQRAAAHPGARTTPGSRSSTTAPRASPPTTSSSSGRHRRSRTSSWARASTRSASPPRAAPVGRWPNGSSHGAPIGDLTGVDIRRFAPFNGNNRWLHDRVAEVLGVHYEIPWPNRELTTARPFRRSPVHHLLEAADANFGSRMGWERANFFAPAGADPDHRILLGQAELAAVVGGRAGQHPHRRHGVRPDVVLQVPRRRAGRRGRTAVALHGRRRRAVGRTVYTGMLNARGTLRVRRHRHAHRPPTNSSSSAARPRPSATRTTSAGTCPPASRADPGRRDLGRTRCSASWARGHASCWRASTDADLIDDGVPVRHQPADHARLRHRPRHPDHLRRRARLGALRADRIRGRACTRT